jgi:hypothetical protein
VEASIQTEGFQKRATMKQVFGGIGALGIGAFFVVVCNDGYLPKSPLWSAFAAVPFAFCITGTIESVSRRPYRELAGSWKTLRKSQRVWLGIFLSLAALLVFELGVGSLFHIWLIAHGDG